MPRVFRTRHDDIREDEVRAPALFQVSDGRIRIFAGRDPVAEPGQDGADVLAHPGLVLDQQDQLIVADGRRRRSGTCGTCSVHRPGENQRHLRSLAGLGRDGQPAAGLRHEPERHAEPEADALADRFGCKEGLKTAPQRLAVHAGARIGDRQNHVLRAALLGQPRRQRQHTALLHGIARIDGKVQQHEFELRRIAFDARLGCA